MTAMVASDDTAYDAGYTSLKHTGRQRAGEFLNSHLADLSKGAGPDFWYAVGVRDAYNGYPYSAPSARTPQPSPGPTGGTGGTGTPGTYVTPPKPGSLTGRSPASPVGVLMDSVTQDVLRTPPAPVAGRAPVVLRPAPPYVPRGQPGAVVPAPSTPPPYWPPLFEQTLSRARYLEVCAFIFGKRVYYDTAVQLNRAASGGLLEIVASVGISFEILGDAPGEKNRGFKLSGPGGPIARRVAALVASGDAEPNPRRYGLNDWVAAKTRDGIRFLTPAELEQLGLYTE